MAPPGYLFVLVLPLNRANILFLFSPSSSFSCVSYSFQPFQTHKALVLTPFIDNDCNIPALDQSWPLCLRFNHLHLPPFYPALSCSWMFVCVFSALPYQIVLPSVYLLIFFPSNRYCIIPKKFWSCSTTFAEVLMMPLTK